MKVIISFAGLEDRQDALGSRRPFPLQPVAGSTILGHILERLQDVPASSYVILVDAHAEAINASLRQLLPKALVQVIMVEEVEEPFMALKSRDHLLDDGPALFVSGGFIAEADFGELSSIGADVVFFVQDSVETIPAETWFVNEIGDFSPQGQGEEVFWAGMFWIRRGGDLLLAISGTERDELSSVRNLLSFFHKHGLTVRSLKANTCLGVESPPHLLHANARLMQLGYCSAYAIERSYAEEFTVLPPVFLHESAVVENAVIGPFVNLEAGAIVSNSIVRNSLIGSGAQIKNVVLDGSLIGDQARVTGTRQAVIVGDESNSNLD